jgi:hypothetical protein
LPAIRNRTVLTLARNVSAFFNLEAGVTRPENLPTSETAQDGENAALREQLESRRRQLADKDAEIQRLQARLEAPDSRRGGIRPESLVWIFGSGRTGSTWLSRLMSEVEGHSVWFEPQVGDLFGGFYYGARNRQRANGNFVLGDPRKETWLESVRNLVLDGAAARFPDLAEDGYLIVKEPQGSIGAPLLMQALPESRQILLIRDPRDVVASTLDAHREGSWAHGRNQDMSEDDAMANERPDEFVRMRIGTHYKRLEKAWQSYEEHEGTKVLVRYEDLQSDTLGTLKRLYSELGMTVEEDALSTAVEKHSWKNVPEERKGEGKFYRKGASGGWKEDLTPEQVAIVEEIAAPLIREFYD